MEKFGGVEGGGWYSSDADTVTGCEPGRIHPAGSSWALSLGFTALRQGRDLKCSLRRDQAESRFGLEPHKHKLAENKETAEKQPLFKASGIPLRSQQK